MELHPRHALYRYQDGLQRSRDSHACESYACVAHLGVSTVLLAPAAVNGGHGVVVKAHNEVHGGALPPRGKGLGGVARGPGDADLAGGVLLQGRLVAGDTKVGSGADVRLPFLGGAGALINGDLPVAVWSNVGVACGPRLGKGALWLKKWETRGKGCLLDSAIYFSA